MKKITFDEEELFAIAVFEPDTRVNTIKRLERVLPELQDDPEMRDLIRSAREKLKKISDREYSLLDLDSYREELEWDMNEEENGIDAETAEDNVEETEKQRRKSDERRTQPVCGLPSEACIKRDKDPPPPVLPVPAEISDGSHLGSVRPDLSF